MFKLIQMEIIILVLIKEIKDFYKIQNIVMQNY